MHKVVLKRTKCILMSADQAMGLHTFSLGVIHAVEPFPKRCPSSWQSASFDIFSFLKDIFASHLEFIRLGRVIALLTFNCRGVFRLLIFCSVHWILGVLLLYIFVNCFKGFFFHGRNSSRGFGAKLHSYVLISKCHCIQCSLPPGAPA